MAENKCGIRKKRAAWLASLGVAAAVLCSCVTGTLVSVHAEEEFTQIPNGAETTLDTVLSTGSEYTLPTNVVLTEGGKSYRASVILRDPDGNGITAETVTLTLAGRYTVEYRAKTDEGKLLMAREYFSCLDPLFSVTSPRSNAEYTEGTTLHNEIKGGAGIGVSVAKGDRFEYNQILDLSQATMNDKLISFYVTPELLYNYDAGQINFVLTDAFDEDNSVTITVKRTLLLNVADMQHYSYITANASDQPPTAVNLPVQAQYPAVTVDGTRYSLHVSNMYGRAIRHSMYGGHEDAKDEASYLGKEMSLSFDAATNRVYAWAIGAAEPVLVADLDDPVMFDNLWQGFTDGKALLSVNMSSYRALTSNLVITKIGGDDLTESFAKDSLAPAISVDLNGYDANALPKARVGSEYPVFPATASDETDGSVLCDVSVWYNYASEETRTRVSTDGKTFTPSAAGTYTIVYSAKDRSGNVENATYHVEAEALPALELDYTAAESCTAGKPFAFTDVSLTGGSGEKSLRVKAVLDSDDSVSYELTDSGNGKFTFVPLHAGKYTVTFTYSDWLEEKTVSHDVTAAAATGAYIAEEANVPRYVIAGATYPIPALSGYTFDNGVQEKGCTFSAEGGTVNGNTFRVTAQSGNVTLKYTLEMAGGEKAEKTYAIPVVAGTGVDGEANTLDMSKLFVQSNFAHEPASCTRADAEFTFSAEDYTGRLVATVSNSGSGMAYGAFDFVNKVLASKLETQFTLPNTEFLRVVLYITDSANPDQQVKVTYANGGSWRVNFSVNDGYTYATSYNGSSTFALAFDAETYTFRTDTNVSAPAANYLNGKPFRGFESGFVYLTWQLEGVYAATGEAPVKKAAIQINNINNQTISPVKSDNIDPQVNEYISKGDLAVGSITEIPAFTVCDVINPYAVITVRVLTPDKQAVTSVDGVALDGTQDISRPYEIKLSAYGSYSIEVAGRVGAAGTAFGVTYGISVLDMSAPEVVFLNPVTEAKVGQTVPFAGIHVSDDTTKAEDITVTAYLMGPDGKMTKVDLKQYGSFTPSAAGEYRFVIYACDEGNRYGSAQVSNTAIVWYTITVTA